MIAVLLGYLPLLLLTLAVELAVVAAAAPRSMRGRALAACLALNLFTHPTATLVSWWWSSDFIALELLVFFVEWLGYSLLLAVRAVPALRYAFLPNLCSALAGVGLVIARMG